MAGVKLEGVRKVYDNGHVALHDATFDVGDGEFIVLVGPSGCGKSTTLRMIAGLESVTEGRLFIGERLVNDVTASARDIAMVFQNYALYPHMTVRDNMAFALKLRNESRAEIDQRVNEAAAILGLEPVLARKPRQLSGGQRQRVAVGRAIVRKPQVFLFDEPLSNLDAKLRVQMRKEISRLHRQLAATMIYVTHDQVEAMTMGDRIVVMSEGHIQQIGTPLELYERPANRFVAGFIGSPAMNFLEGTLEVDGGGPVLRALDGKLVVPLPPSTDANVDSLLHRPLLLGIRPEHLYLAEGPYVPQPNCPFVVRLEVVEPMGNEIFLYAGHEDREIVARVTPQPLPRPEQTVTLALDSSRIHLFDAVTGRAIALHE